MSMSSTRKKMIRKVMLAILFGFLALLLKEHGQHISFVAFLGQVADMVAYGITGDTVLSR